MSRPVRVSPRSFLIAGMSAAVVGAAVLTPVNAPAPRPARITTAVELTSIASGLQGVIDGINGVVDGINGIFTNLNAFTTGVQATIDHILSLPDGVQASIKTAYNTTEAWPAYAAAWANFSLGLIPGLWWLAPSIPLAYNTVEPLIRAGFYSTADVIGLDPGQFVKDLRNGVKTSSDNADLYLQVWADSFVSVPTLPPYPGPPPSSPDYVPDVAAAASAAALAAPQAAAIGGIENAIKNTYNAVEPWVAWGFQLVQWGMGFVPGLWYLAPGVDLAYYSIEPLVQAGVYAFADVLGLNFSQIGPDVTAGIKQSAQNVVTYALAWLQSLVPFPPLPPFPPRPGAAVSAAAAVRGAAAVEAADLATTQAVTASAPVGDGVTTGEDAGQDSASTGSSIAADRDHDTAPVESQGVEAPALEVHAAEAPATETPAIEAPAAETPAAPTAVDATDVPAGADAAAPAAEAPKPSRGAHLGHRSPTADNGAKAAAGAASSARAARSAG